MFRGGRPIEVTSIHLAAGEAQRHTSSKGDGKNVKLIDTGAIFITDKGAVPLLHFLLFALQRWFGLVQFAVDKSLGLDRPPNEK